MNTLIKLAAVAFYATILIMAVLAVAGALPQVLIGLPMGGLAYHAIDEICQAIRA